MNMRIFFSFVRKALAVLITTTFLYSCGDNKQSSPPIKKALQSFKKETNLKGLVTDNKAPVKAGMIKATDGKNRIIATEKLQDDGHYKIKIPANTLLPILLTVTPSEDLDTGKLVAAVVYTSMTKFDINPLTTKIAKKAKALGGYTHKNMVLAAESMVDVPNKNKTTRGFRGDPTKQYGGWH